MTNTAHDKNRATWSKLMNICTGSTYDDAMTLRKAAMTLHRWYEKECNGEVQQDETNGKWHVFNTNTGKFCGMTADLEKGATARIKLVCERLGLHYYLQTDPRGGTLYVDNKPINCQTYNRATFIA